MRNLVLGLLIIISISLNAQESFEGVISYKVEVNLKYEDHQANDYLLKKWGDTVQIFHHRSGYQKRVFKNSLPMGMDFTIYNPDKNEYYLKWHLLDTIYYYNCSENVTSLEGLKEGDSEIVLGKKCKSIIVKMKELNREKFIRAKYFYDEDLSIDPSNYKKFKDFHFDEIYQTCKAHLVKWHLDVELCEVIFTAIKVEKKELSLDLFKVPQNFPMKYF